MTKMTDDIQKQLKLLGLRHLSGNWETTLAKAKRKKPSYFRFLKEIIEQESQICRERRRISRIKRANIEELLVLETFPFSKQPRLKRKMILEEYDSLEFMQKKQDMLFIGPTGCGKTGLATSFLVHAINNDYRGCFTDFKDLVDELYASLADHSEEKAIRKYTSYDCLVIDELGYIPITKEQAGLFFDLMRKRHKKKSTLITTQLAFSEWNSFLQNRHLTAALIDRLTVCCTIFNLEKCVSIRPKKIKNASYAKK